MRVVDSLLKPLVIHSTFGGVCLGENRRGDSGCQGKGERWGRGRSLITETDGKVDGNNGRNEQGATDFTVTP